MRIINFGQMIDVETRQLAHQIVVETVDGRQHVVTTDEATVSQLIAAMSNNVQAAQVQSMPTQVASIDEEAFNRYLPDEEPEFEEGAEIFGGEEDPGETGREPVMGVIAEDRIAEVEEPGGLGQPAPKRSPAQLEVTPPPKPVRTDADGFVMPVHSRTVPKDEMGYPIVQQKGQRAPLIPDDDGEDDGAQI